MFLPDQMPAKVEQITNSDMSSHEALRLGY